MTRRFKALLEGRGPHGAWVYLPIPFDVEKAFGSRARIAVTGTINGKRFRSSAMPQGDGTHAMMVRKSLSKAAGASKGDRVSVVMSVDQSKRRVVPPPGLKAALAANPSARAFFQTLSYSSQKEFAVWVACAKKEETRTRRIHKTIALLRDRRRQR